ncbi:hypothetical protein GALMADRAFT_225049 [Galerina marginata CBS 339.88]|uniref:Uncharacterized protein n=1 Tax=Galerina marginata (strain CBS 339.88) TaxID=685588 RepID=A0A067TD28_GALM3|nr:hypothetical protein GALMADRAFT_225049 [Galerina marginata CBS 339.88]
MITSNSPFTKLPPELFPVVAAHLPLYATPTTLYSLALTNHGLHEIISPLLYSCMVLRNQRDALTLLQRMLVDRQLGHLVRELHIMSEGPAVMLGDRDVLTGLRKVVQGGLLPYIHTLGLYLLQNDWQLPKILTEADIAFWKELRGNCPRLRGIVIFGLEYWRIGGWDTLFQVIQPNESRPALSHLAFDIKGPLDNDNGGGNLLKGINHFSPSLQTLVLRSTEGFASASHILTLEFPCLKSLTLDGFRVRLTSEAMTFWRKHASLERVRLSNGVQSSRWFYEHIEPGLLPNLMDFRADFSNVLPLAHILGQLTSLSIEKSINAQVPYLLRVVIPEGLPRLKSLEIVQVSASFSHFSLFVGATWYETADASGIFHEGSDLEQAGRDFTGDYIYSITKGAPNLEELALHGSQPLNWTIRNNQFVEPFSGFTRLERLYYGGPNVLFSTDLQDTHRDASLALATACKSIRTVTDVSLSTVPYLTAQIRRNPGGEVDEVMIGKGYGTQIGSEGDPFPRTLQRSSQL